MRVLFMGSGDVAAPTLRRIVELGGVEVVGVVTQPERPKGRGLQVAACPMMTLAGSMGLRVLAPEKVGAEGSVQEIAALRPDLIVVAAYGQYIKPAILEVPRLGAINLHPSLLPRYRGAAPIQMAVASGETETGVSIIDVAREMDAGDILLQERIPIDPDDTAATLTPRLAEAGADLMVRAIEQIRQGTARRTPQDGSRATYVPRLTKEDGRIDWHRSAADIRNRIRGFYPWPCCHCEIPAGSGRMVKVLAARVEPGAGAPGRLLDAGRDGPLVATGQGALRLLTVQPPGKQHMTGGAFLNGHPLPPDVPFG